VSGCVLRAQPAKELAEAVRRVHRAGEGTHHDNQLVFAPERGLPLRAIEYQSNRGATVDDGLSLQGVSANECQCVFPDRDVSE
jgi:hypothetical protein